MDAVDAYHFNEQDLDAWAEALIDQGRFDEIAQALQGLEAAQIGERPSLLRLQAHAAYQQGDFEQAFPLIQEAQQLAVHQDAWRPAVYCALDEARWWQTREQYEAAHLALEAARRLAERMPVGNIELQADLLLAVSRLMPDFSQNREAVVLCDRALHLYERIGHLAGQVQSLWLLSVINTYMAHLTEARAQIERALLLHQMAGLAPVLRLYLLNVSAHVHLYAGQAQAGLQVVRRDAAGLLQEFPHSKPALYLVMAEGALLRQQRRFTETLAVYDRAEKIVDALEDEGYRPWLAFHRGWTHVLMGESPARVRATLMQAGVLQNEVMVRALNMYLAALDVLEERFVDAEALLEKISVDFDQSAHFLELFAVRVYQARVYEQQGRVGRLREAMERSLGWAEEAGVDYFPHYWHPQVVAGVCMAALRLGVHSRQAELMIIRRLGDVAAPGLVGLLADESLTVRQRARSVLAALGDDAFQSILDGAPGPRLNAILLAHVRQGR
ncbi:MAG TPA: hypothetical protein G4N94_04240, partial [Caldilineae bacterium]|nr:hypothetical protein [Caldilineae bacterium]